MEFKCSQCDYSSYNKHCVLKHLSKQTKCGEGTPTLIEKHIDIECDFCKKPFATKPNLNRHLKICKVKKSNLEKELIIEKEKNDKLEREVEILKALIKKPNTSIGTQNNNININLAPWNDPKLPEDVERYYRDAVKKIFLAVPTIIKYIHFNTAHPENHNICIKNARNKVAKVYNGKEWESIDEDILIRTLINDYEQTLEDYAEEKAPKYNEKMRVIKDRDSEEKVYDDLHTEVKRVIYDRNHMVKVKN
jgi:hypothetical protein